MVIPSLDQLAGLRPLPPHQCHQLHGGQSQAAPPNANTAAADPPKADPPETGEPVPPESSDPPA